MSIQCLLFIVLLLNKFYTIKQVQIWNALENNGAYDVQNLRNQTCYIQILMFSIDLHSNVLFDTSINLIHK